MQVTHFSYGPIKGLSEPSELKLQCSFKSTENRLCPYALHCLQNAKMRGTEEMPNYKGRCPYTAETNIGTIVRVFCQILVRTVEVV